VRQVGYLQELLQLNWSILCHRKCNN